MSQILGRCSSFLSNIIQTIAYVDLISVAVVILFIYIILRNLHRQPLFGEKSKRDVESVDDSAELLPHNLGRIIDYRSNIFGFKSMEESYNKPKRRDSWKVGTAFSWGNSCFSFSH